VISDGLGRMAVSWEQGKKNEETLRSQLSAAMAVIEAFRAWVENPSGVNAKAVMSAEQHLENTLSRAAERAAS